MKTLFQRSKANPILKPEHMPIPCAAVMNPGATEQNSEVVLLLRVEDRAGHSSIHVAHSKNGESNWHVEPKPFLKYGDPRFSYENWGVVVYDVLNERTVKQFRIADDPSGLFWYYTLFPEEGLLLGQAGGYSKLQEVIINF